jgi:aerotaxis receptor
MPKAGFKDLWDTVKMGKPWSGIVINRTKNDNYYWVYTTVTPSRDVKGNIRYVSVRVKPTDKEVENAKALYKTLT